MKVEEQAVMQILRVRVEDVDGRRNKNTLVNVFGAAKMMGPLGVNLKKLGLYKSNGGRSFGRRCNIRAITEDRVLERGAAITEQRYNIH